MELTTCSLLGEFAADLLPPTAEGVVEASRFIASPFVLPCTETNLSSFILDNTTQVKEDNR
jgi:hypothetical protein